MKRNNYLLCKIFYILCLLATSCDSFSQSIKESDTIDIQASALSSLTSMPANERELLIKMAIQILPKEQKREVENILKAMNSTTLEVKSITIKDKKVSFIPLAHVCTPEFYEKVRDSVKAYKAKGYKVYFEEVKQSKTAPGKHLDTLELKLRKFIGIKTDRKTFSMLEKVFPNVITQPNYKDLGVTDTDLNADVTVEQLVNRYEKLYGKINLTKCDFDTEIENILYSCDKLNNDVDPVILDYRNEYVANIIKTSKDKKILVLYGAGHISGMIDLIQGNK